MIQQLYSFYHNFLGINYQESLSYQHKKSEIMVFDRAFAHKGIRLLTCIWAIYQLYNYYLLSLRPVELYAPMYFFQQILMPSFPSLYTVLFFSITTFLLSIFTYKENKYSIFFNIALTFCVLWLNAMRWNYGFFSHVGHIFIFSHLFFIFIPANDTKKSIEVSKMIQLAHFGILVTYTFSGIWKIIGVFGRLIFKPNEITWLNKDAVLHQVIIGYVDWDLPFPNFIDVFNIPIIWQCSFIGMVSLQLGSFLGAFRKNLLPWILLGNIAFHLINAIFFKIPFWLTPLTLFIVFFPYHIFKQKNTSTENIWTGKYNKAIYKRKYEKEEDIYEGFYAYRAKFTDQNKWWNGLLYIPFLSLICTLYWNLKKDPTS